MATGPPTLQGLPAVSSALVSLAPGWQASWLALLCEPWSPATRAGIASLALWLLHICCLWSEVGKFWAWLTQLASSLESLGRVQRATWAGSWLG